METAIKSKFALLERIDNHIVKATFSEQNGKVKEEHIRVTYSDSLALLDGKLKYLYVVTGEYTLLSKEARAQVVKEAEIWDKQAVLIHNLAQRIMGNFVIKRIGLKNKMQLFTKENEALKWLALP
jgi:hypothetical protein